MTNHQMKRRRRKTNNKNVNEKMAWFFILSGIVIALIIFFASLWFQFNNNSDPHKTASSQRQASHLDIPPISSLQQEKAMPSTISTPQQSTADIASTNSSDPSKSNQQPAYDDNDHLLPNEDFLSSIKTEDVEIQQETIEQTPTNAQSQTQTSNGCLLPKDRPAESKQKKKVAFKQWLDEFQTEAKTHGISESTLTNAFKGITPINKVIELDRKQKEYSTTFAQYLRNSISAQRIAKGKAMMSKYKNTLAKIEKEYGVPPQVIVTLWAMESNFGQFTGNFSTIRTLSTLAHEGRRHQFFRGELLCALWMIEDGHVTVQQMKSSWAGAMGQPQFMPSTFQHFATDGNNDSKIDIWKKPADVFASTANYLHTIGWQAKQPWGMEVKLPKHFEPYLASYEKTKPTQHWKTLGIVQANGKPLPDNHQESSIILPSGINGPAFLVFNNFKVLREWNRSTFYVLTIGHLSDRMIGKPNLKTKAPTNEKAITRKQAISVQTQLQELGFYKDKIDGMVGLKTRDAIREYQFSKGLVADAYLSTKTIQQLHIDHSDKKTKIVNN